MLSEYLVTFWIAQLCGSVENPRRSECLDEVEKSRKHEKLEDSWLVRSVLRVASESHP